MKTLSLSLGVLAFASLVNSTLAAPATAGASTWSTYRGPAGDGTTKEAISGKWGSSGPKQQWKSPATQGFSSMTVAEGIATSLVTRDTDGVPTEVCVAWDVASGKELWASPLKNVKYDGGGDSGTPENKGGDGPRSTPSMAAGHVYVYGANMDLICFEAKTGKTVWAHNIKDDHEGKNIQWQNATSPIIDGELCIVSGGGSGQAFLAFNLKDGKLVWKSGDEKMTHATPTVATILGQKQIIFFTQSGLTALNLKDGSLLWHQAYPYKVSTAASPVVWQDIVYCSAGYGVGGGAYKISKKGSGFATEEIWRTEGKNNNHWSTPIVKDGYLYGMFSFKDYGKGPVACVDIRTGQEKWKKDGFGPGNVILAGRDLLALSDSGELVVMDASPTGYNERSRADVLEGKCWSTPVLSNGLIFARSTKEAGCWSAK